MSTVHSNILAPSASMEKAASMAGGDGVPQWELCKENVLPIKRGRSTKGLQETLSKPATLSDQGQDNNNSVEQLREQLFEEELAKLSTGDSPKDLLEAYLKYLKWVRDRFPTNSDKALKLLEVA
jgi:hypothetical protein